MSDKHYIPRVGTNATLRKLFGASMADELAGGGVVMAEAGADYAALLTEARAAGKALRFAPETHYIASTLALSAGDRVEGYGANLRPAEGLGASDAMLAIPSVLGATHTHVRGIKFSNTGDFGGAADRPCISGDLDYTVIEDCKFSDSKVGIYSESGVGGRIANCMFVGNALHLDLNNQTLLVLRDTHLSGGRGATTLELRDGEGVTFDSCWIEDNDGCMRLLGVREVVFRGGWFENNTLGVNTAPYASCEVALGGLVGAAAGDGARGVIFDQTIFAIRSGQSSITLGETAVCSVTFRDVNGKLRSADYHLGQGSARWDGFASPASEGPLGKPPSLSHQPRGFVAYRTTSTTFATGRAAIAFEAEDWDSSGAFDISTDTYTVPQSGVWRIDGSTVYEGSTVVANTYLLELLKNGSVVAEVRRVTGVAGEHLEVAGSVTLNLTKGDTLQLQRYVPASTTLRSGSGNSMARFGATLVSAS